ncbi:leucine-rich repeat-containing protein kinase family protein [Variovorax sp. ZT4R33]|uniref:leucine-rich repeat-containing protein kinase family protein n=1 Tax=Variovorax sp. ZT4R33 TaxID=3443743 RepID=UPI003F46BD8B
MSETMLARLRSGALAGTQRLDLRDAGLTEFPREIYALADTLEVLDLSRNALDALPDDLPRLHRLRVVFCSDNRFAELPAVLGGCLQLEMVGFKANRIRTVPGDALPPRLRWLILTDNAIESLPAALGQRPRLQKLMLAGNRLRALPDTLATGGTSLELLRIAANRFTALPDWLGALPRLAWLAHGGNPLTAVQEAQALAGHALPEIDWSRLDTGAVLGEGASGVIQRAALQQPDGTRQPVAVKLFKGAMTSDGSPSSEMAAGIAAGLHRGLIGAQGRVVGHPEGAQGLVMPLIDLAFHVLAGPPSLDSCTRDVYAPDTRFTPEATLALAAGMASAAAHLHAHGLMHGDLYAHNILHDSAGVALLGDFGAASFHPAEQAEALERIEVRAFGCLIEELGARCDTADPALRALQARCVEPTVASRPGFAEISAQLDALR